MQNSEFNNIYALTRFVVSILVMAVLAGIDLWHDKDQIPTLVYLMIGALNGIDLYHLVKVSGKGKL